MFKDGCHRPSSRSRIYTCIPHLLTSLPLASSLPLYPSSLLPIAASCVPCPGLGLQAAVFDPPTAFPTSKHTTCPPPADDGNRKVGREREWLAFLSAAGMLWRMLMVGKDVLAAWFMSHRVLGQKNSHYFAAPGRDCAYKPFRNASSRFRGHLGKH